MKKIKKYNLVIHIKNCRVRIEVDPDMYDDDDYKEIRRIIKHMSKNIWIDRSYVAYEGSRWGDAFINEEEWYKFTKIIVDSDYGLNYTEDEESEIFGCLTALILTYLFKILEKYGYDSDSINLTLQNSEYDVEYEDDNRTSWDW